MDKGEICERRGRGFWATLRDGAVMMFTTRLDWTGPDSARLNCPVRKKGRGEIIAREGCGVEERRSERLSGSG